MCPTTFFRELNISCAEIHVAKGLVTENNYASFVMTVADYLACLVRMFVRKDTLMRVDLIVYFCLLVL